mgnify:CR=1 FL=1
MEPFSMNSSPIDSSYAAFSLPIANAESSSYALSDPQADEQAYNYPTDEEFTQWVESSVNEKDIAENTDVKELLDEDGRLYLNDTRINPEYAQALSNEHSINLMADTLPRVLDRVAGKNKEVRTCSAIAAPTRASARR